MVLFGLCFCVFYGFCFVVFFVVCDCVCFLGFVFVFVFFFFGTWSAEIYALSLYDALPFCSLLERTTTVCLFPSPYSCVIFRTSLYLQRLYSSSLVTLRVIVSLFLFVFFFILRPPILSPFPYTTLFLPSSHLLRLLEYFLCRLLPYRCSF